MVPNTVLITIVDGVRIAVPDSLDFITPYVLFEQQDWFEDEIKFLRRLLQPGHNVIDIGANCGVYTLSMAKTVGPAGRVWAFEPALSTATLLAEGIAANGFSHVMLERTALSNARGMAQLFLHQHPEGNTLVHDPQSKNVSETVPVVTLDNCLETYGWRTIDFIKIDAEGEEANILKGGERFFTELSPLVQYEVKEGSSLNIELLSDFASLGYDSYRLVPGLDLFIPFGAEEQPDGFLLNLFCCKPDRAAQLVAQGFMLNVSDLRSAKNQDKDISGHSHSAYDWQNTLAKLPYGIELANMWKQTVGSEQSRSVEEALSLYAESRDSSLSKRERFQALEDSFIRFRLLCEREPSHLRLASLARVALDYGARFISASALMQLSDMLLKHKQFDLSEPFLVPCERFDSIPPGKSLTNWVLAAVLEKYECIRSFSSFYNDHSSLQRLEIIRNLGFNSAEMERRLSLLQQRLASQKNEQAPC